MKIPVDREFGARTMIKEKRVLTTDELMRRIAARSSARSIYLTTHTDSTSRGCASVPATPSRSSPRSVDIPVATLPERGTQILLQDDAISRLTRRFEAAAVSMALQWH